MISLIQPLPMMGVPPTNGIPLTRRVPSACDDTGCVFRVSKWQRTCGRARQGIINPSRYIKEELKPIANLRRCHYPSRALSKILKLALVGYEYTAYTVRLMGFFCMRNISMHSHIVMAKLWRDAFERASYLYYWSTNPFQLCHLNYLVVIGKAPLNTGVHHCA